jgi:protein gp37
MAETTEIALTDSTFNPWWGCTNVGPGCDHCYAQALDKRTGGSHWGIGTAPRVMSGDNWSKPIRWNKKARASDIRHKVFCGSMCDVFDKNAPEGQRDRLWQLISSTKMLD